MFHSHISAWLPRIKYGFFLPLISLLFFPQLIATKLDIRLALEVTPLMWGMLHPLILSLSVAIFVLVSVAHIAYTQFACMVSHYYLHQLQQGLTFTPADLEILMKGVKAGQSYRHFLFAFLDPKTYLHYGLFLFGKHLAENRNEALIKEIQFHHQKRQKCSIDAPYDAKKHFLNLFEETRFFARENESNLFIVYLSVFSKHRLSVDDKGHLVLNSFSEKNLTYTPNEAKKVSEAIFQMAKAVKEDNLEDKYLVGSGIFFLLKAFAQCHPIEEVLQSKWKLQHYVQHLIWRLDSHLKITQENAPVFLQRAYRAHLYKKALKAKIITPIEPAKLPFMQEPPLNKLLSPPIPSTIKHLTGAQKKTWAKKAKQKYGSLAFKMADLITFRTHKQFMKRLSETIGQFNEYLHSLSQMERSFILVIPERQSSNQWVTALGLKYFTKEPDNIVEVGKVDSYLNQHPQVKNVVYLDDAIYSGRQLRDYIGAPKKGVKQILIVPYYNASGLGNFSQEVVKILGERMLTPWNMLQARIWTYEEKMKLDTTFPESWNSPSSKVGVYFQHRLADEASTFLNSLRREEKELIPEEPIKPYGFGTWGAPG